MPKPTFNFVHNDYRAAVRVHTPGYSDVPPRGRRTGRSYSQGAVVDLVTADVNDDWVSVLTVDGVWINVWGLWHYGEPLGVTLCRILVTPKPSLSM